MNKRYIDIDSGFRDRKIWPNPAEFGIQLAQTGTKYGVTNAKNPITLAYPYYQWQWGCLLTNGNQIPSGAPVTPSGRGIDWGNLGFPKNTTLNWTTGGTGTAQQPVPQNVITDLGGNAGPLPVDPFGGIILNGTVTNTLTRNNNFFNGLFYEANTAAANTYTYSRIVSYKANENTLTTLPGATTPLAGVFTVESELTRFVPNSQQQITNNINPGIPIAQGNAASAAPNAPIEVGAEVFIPGGVNADGVYVGDIYEAILYTDLTARPQTHQFRTIVAYDGTRRVATLNNPLVTGAVAGQITPSNTTNAGAPGRAIGIYLHRIRRSLPLLPLDAPDVATANMPLTNNRQDNIQGAVYSIEIVNQGANYVVGQATITPIGGGAALLNITDVTPQGGITGIIITIPGTPPSSGFSVGQVLNVVQGVGINGTVRVTGTGYGVNVGTWDGTGAPTSAQPFGITNQGGIYTGQIFYLPSLNQPQSTPTGTTLTDPSAAQQFIVQNNTRVNLTNDEPYTNDSTASSIIRGDFFEANPPVGVNQAHFLVIDPFENVFSGTIPASGSGFEFNILPYDEDHVVPMNYTGSTVSQSQMVCYQMTLESITIPNVTITALGLGGLIAFYPYIYVEFRNESASSSQGNTPTLYSNNPASNTALWKCSITDTPTPLISKFIKIRADGMQTVKFKPNDDLYFKVTLPNGQTFETSTKDTAPPLLPNLLLQISFSVGIERL